MTLRTATYDDSKFKIVPIEPSEEWRLKLAKGKCEWDTAFDVITDVIAAAPEYQDTCTDGGKCGAGGYCKDCGQEPTKDE